MLLFFSAMGLVVGCGEPDETIDLTFDPCANLAIEPGPDATTAEIQTVDRAIGLWNDAAGAHLTRGAHEPGAAVVTVRFEPAAPFFFGVYDDEAGAIYINDTLPGEPARSITLAHELGHAFGLPHVRQDVRRSVMNPANLEEPPSAEDIQDLASIWGDCRAREGMTP